jgi:hypothetical protein
LFIIAPYLSVIAQDGRNATQNITLQVAGTALLGVAGPPVVLKLAGAMEAGDSVSNEATNSATRLRISSLVLGEESRSITAKISEPLVGTQLSVELAAPNANFGVPEQKGDLKGSKYLDSEIEAILVDGIGTCWSGKSDDDGYVIKYAFKALRGAPLLRSSNVTVTYTISQTPSELEPVE